MTVWSYNPEGASPHLRFGLFPVRSPLLRESLTCFLFLRVLRCFSSPGSPPYNPVWIAALQAAGLSHSEIPASTAICAYTGLIAAYHVLLRLREPRHPPCALFCFAVLRPAMTKTPRRELILSAVVLTRHAHHTHLHTGRTAQSRGDSSLQS